MASAAVMQFAIAFMLLTLLDLVFLLRVQAVGAWLRPVPPPTFSWITGSWLLSISVLILVLVLAPWSPLVALIILATSGTTVSTAVAFLAPPDYGNWGI
jgi:hypothetical protein